MQFDSLTRILFMGTPDFAVPTLRALHERGAAHGWEVVAVATQPDRPAGRGKQLVASPVKGYAAAAGIPVLQPASLRKDPAAVETLRALAPDAIVVAAYGLILPKAVLEIPTFGCLNVHASLLPAYRGASPISAAILDGLDETGVSIMLMDEGMDTGPVLRQASQPILPVDTTESLSLRLAEQGADLLVATLAEWLAGTVAPIPQEELPGAPSACRLLRKEDGLIDWAQPAAPHRAHDPGVHPLAHGLYAVAWRPAADPGGAGAAGRGGAGAGGRCPVRPRRGHGRRAAPPAHGAARRQASRWTPAAFSTAHGTS